MKLGYSIVGIMLCCLMSSCGNLKRQAAEEAMRPVGVQFNADSAMMYCQKQCDFGPRTMNSEAHEQCAKWIAETFSDMGLEVNIQEASLKGYDGTPLRCKNIIASYKPSLKDRIMICAHWDSRPWADNDPDEANWHKPVMAANDGASGVGVMLEIARQLMLTKRDSTQTTLEIGVDFICFDAEDYGFPQWEDGEDPGNTWALGAQHWAKYPHEDGYKARFGILLDMVGGQGASFYKEGMSEQYASRIVDKVWKAAQVAGYGSRFLTQTGGGVMDDHIPVNTIAKIPCVDIIPYYPTCTQSSFGPTWHTVQDDMAHLDKNTLQAVGQTVIQVLFSEQ